MANSFWTKVQKQLNEERIGFSAYVWEQMDVHLKEKEPRTLS